MSTGAKFQEEKLRRLANEEKQTLLIEKQTENKMIQFYAELKKQAFDLATRIDRDESSVENIIKNADKIYAELIKK